MQMEFGREFVANIVFVSASHPGEWAYGKSDGEVLNMNNDLDRLKEILPLGSDFIELNFPTGDVTGLATDGIEPSGSPSGRVKGQKTTYSESEAELQQKAIDYLHLKGYRVAHFRKQQLVKSTLTKKESSEKAG